MFSCLFQILSVIRKPAMRTPRNLFILNLAVSDLLLCTVTMPLTLMEIITKYFPLGNNIFICKFIGILQATSIYVSTITITAIALDRYQVSELHKIWNRNITLLKKTFIIYVVKECYLEIKRNIANFIKIYCFIIQGVHKE